MLHKEITFRIIKAFFKVYNALGYGFLEKVYENALVHELERDCLRVERQFPIKVYYDGLQIGEYFADLLVENCIIIELKAAEGISEQHKAQLLNYLKATGIEIGLLFNFGPEPKFVRKILTNNYKPNLRVKTGILKT